MEEKQPPEEQSGDAKATSVMKKHALPLSVILTSWFCGIIACGFTCSFALTPAAMILHDSSDKIRLAAWAWWGLAILLGVYVGLHIGKDVRSRYRKGNQ